MNISGGGTPTISNVETSNLTGSGANDSITLTGAQLDAIIIGAGTINLGGGTDTINLTSTSSDLNTLGATDASIQGVEAISASTAAAGVTITLSGQSEAFTITGSANADTITGGSGADTISAGAGNDTINVASGQFGVGESIDGGANTDTVVLTNATTVDFSTGTLTAVENLTGSSGVDTVTLSAAQWSALSAIDLGASSDTLNVLASGTVTISGGGTPTISNSETGNLTGSGANDSITLTGAQLDAIIIGTGTINLGLGTDTINLTSTSSDLNTLGATDASIQGVEAISASTAAAGVTITLSGQSEAFTITGSANNDTLTGGAGADTIVGGAGADALSGGGGADILVGGLGNDTVTGGAAADQFRLRTDGGLDTITDYTDNVDKIGFLGGAVPGGVTFANTTATAAGTTLNAGDSVTRGSINQINNNDDNFVDVITGAQSTSLITTTAAGTATNTYAIVFNSDTGRGEIWFDTNWSDAANRVQIATLNNITTLAGVTAITASDIVVYDSTIAPAGIAGSPINLGLTSVPADHVGEVSVTVDGVPVGWTINGGTDHGNGSWTVQASDPSALAVTTPVDFYGARVLSVTVVWTNADGSIGSLMLDDNVEAYAPGSPIFALSADDHLTASTGDDLFVFAQPIAHDTIHSFDASHDKIDLIGFTGVSGFANLSIADDANGNAVITTSVGSTITVLGVHAADLSAANFEFNVEPVTINTGTMTIADGAILPLGGVIENSGTIALGSTGSETDLQILVESVTLQGGGHVVLSDNANNVIFGGAASATLINVDNTISGAGQIGAGQMTLVNAGTIVADGSHALVIDTGSNTVVNTGTLAASGSGVLMVDSAVSGHGSAAIGGHGAIEFGAASDANVGFAGDASGTLSLDHAAGFSGTITGLNADDTLYFGDMTFSASAQLSYTANAAGTAGALVVSDGTQTAHISLIGHYAADAFQLSAKAGGGTAVSNTAIDNGTVLGTSGADVLTGTAGNDILVGGQGSDTLTGGAGSDTFMFRSSDGGAVDTITDFDAGAGGDTLGIGALLQGYSDGAGLAQFISLRQSGSDTVVSVDMDGSGSAHEFQDLLILQGVTGLDFATLMAHVDAHPLP